MATEQQAIDISEIERRVLDFLHGQLLGAGVTVTRDRDLLSGEVLDSLSVLRLAAYLQREFQIGIQPADFTVENFRNVAAVAGCVRRALDAALAEPSGP